MPTQLAIGPFWLSTDTRELVGPGGSARLGDRAFNLLRLLAERRDQVVPKTELLAHVWPDTTVDEAALRFQIVGLRRILSAPHAPEVRILNAAGRGYMLTIGESPREARERQGSSHNLPRENVQLIGRNEEIADIIGRLRSERFVSLIGLGGVGKTSIALAVASRVLGEFQRVGWIDFSSLDDPSKAILTVSTALQIPPGAGDPLLSIVAHLRAHSTLLVLDNCEHVIEQAARLADALLDGTMTARLLATSREPVRISRERIYRVQPLSVPPQAAVGDAAAMLEYSAIELFAERAGTRYGYSLTDADVDAVSTICRHLDGIPLAIELAAGWTEAFPPKLLAAELQAHLLRAEGGPWDVPTRHRTLEATLQWSFDRLKPELKAQFERLSVFHGEFDLEAAVAVTGGIRAEALAGLAELVAKSLVNVRRTDEGAAYRLLLVPRAYAEEKLKQGAHELEARRSHAQVVLHWLHEYEVSLTEVVEFPAWLVRYGAIVDDLRAALEWALSPDGDLEIASRLAHDGAVAWFRLSLPFEGKQHLTETLRRLEALPSRNPQLETRIKTAKAVLTIFSADWTAAEIPSLEESMRLGVDRTTLQLIAWCHWVTCHRLRRYRAALGHAEQFLAMSDPNELPDQLAAERMLSFSHFTLGRLAEARRGLEHVISVSAKRATYSPATRFQYDQVSGSYMLLAHALRMMGDYEGAREAAARSIAVAESTKHSLLIAFTLLWTALVAINLGDPDGADKALDKLEPYIAGRNVDKGAADSFRALTLAQRGLLDEAAAIVRRIFDTDNLEQTWYSMVLLEMCEILARAGEPQRALNILDNAMKKFPLDPEDSSRPDCLRAKASLMVMTFGRAARDEALALLDEGLSQARAQGSRDWEVRILAERERVLELFD